MSHRYPLLVLVTVVMLAITAYAGHAYFHEAGLPLDVTVVNAHTARVQPFAGIPLPAGLKAGSQIDLSASDLSTRIALLPDLLGGESTLSPNGHYVLMLRSDTAQLGVPVTSTELISEIGGQQLVWLGTIAESLYLAITLLLLWRGRDRNSLYMTLWIGSVWLGSVLAEIPAAGSVLLSMQLITIVCFLLARVGFYFTIESMLGAALSPGRRMLFRSIFLLVLLIGAIQQFGGVLIFVIAGWAELLRPAYGLMFSASYLVPAIMLILNYDVAGATRRLRLRWMLWGSIIWTAGVFLSNTPVPSLDPVASAIIINGVYAVSMVSVLYAVLRHRVVNVALVLDRTLVYGSVTAIVVGILAALNSVLQHAALGTSASLLLQIVVPLALGIVLSQVRKYADKIVTRVFFHKRYLAEQALRRFARSAAGYDHAEPLLAAAVQTLHKELGAPDVAAYVRTDGGYRATSCAGKSGYPQELPGNDNALAAARAGLKDIDLFKLHSALGADGYVYALGQQAVLICANRPGEHYAADERKLLAHVARHVGTALDALRAQDAMRRLEAKASLVDTLAHSTWPPPPEIQVQARELAASDAAA